MIKLIALLLVNIVKADCYMQSPRGSNNKLNEQSNTVQNDARLFDSQNNAQSGYQVGDACIPNCLTGDDNNNPTYQNNYPGAGMGVMEYYEGSELWIDWTNQHGSQSPFLKNNIVLQYACDDGKYTTGLRDGKIRDTIPLNENAPNINDYGQHESHEWYYQCANRTRNLKLFTADRNLNGNTARFTRQNNNGDRSGLECPEERDYYPYWHPTPWRDIWVCTSNAARCPQYKANSQNVRDYGLCSNPEINNEPACTYNKSTWVTEGSWSMPPPSCSICPTTRNNHNGNTVDGDSPHYTWKIPNIHKDGTKCILRIRYNITTSDFPDDWNTFSTSNGGNSPVKNDPVADWLGFGQNVSGPLKLNIDTSQFGRTFEDRSHIFKIRKRPNDLKCGLRTGEDCRIINLNVRGRRGNIQQTYPAVEYDFVPPKIEAERGDYVHIQWTGADSNNVNNAGNGRRGTDRNNLVVVSMLSGNYPQSLIVESAKPMHFSNNRDKIAFLAFLNQTGCNLEQTSNNANDNCKILNRAPGYIDAGLVQLENIGQYHLLSTRNNAFTNREQKSVLIVKEDVATAVAGAAISLSALGFLAACGVFTLRYAKKNPESKLGAFAAKYKIIPTSPTGDEEEHPPTLAEKYPILGIFLEWYTWNQPRFWYALFFFASQIGAFMFGVFMNQKNKEPFFPYAKGCGKVLDVNLGLILIPVLRNFMSFLRTTPIVEKIPLDDAILIHKWTAYSIALMAFGHILFHFLDFAWIELNLAIPTYISLFTNVAGITGLMITTLMLAMFSTAFMKRKIYNVYGYRFDGYKMFLKVHRLWIPVYGLLIFHGAQVWQFLLFPLIFMFFEKYIQQSRVKMEVKVVDAKMVGRDVLCLKMKLSGTKKKFRYKAGQYLYLCCPAINETEYHPFTITSAPEDPIFSCHIRCRSDMDFTFALRKLMGFDPENKALNVQKPTDEPSIAKTADVEEGIEMMKKEQSLSHSPLVSPLNRANSKGDLSISFSQDVTLRVDGPFGSASEEVFDYETVVLVGAGIGVTPFISILRSISLKVQGGQYQNDISIYFYWICRDQAEFDSFKDFFKEIVQIKELSSSVELNMYVTGEMNLKSVKVDPAYNQFSGRPNWNRILKEKAVRYKGQEVGVFLCGPAAVAQELSVACKTHSTKKKDAGSPIKGKNASNSPSPTTFKFHKENF